MIAVLVTAFACGERGPPAPAKVLPSEAAAAPHAARPGSAGDILVSDAGATSSVAATDSSPSPVAPGPAPLPASYLYGGARLSHLFAALAALEAKRAHPDGTAPARESKDVRILQYGDSHTASDTGTGVFRRLLQARFGSGGRGFVAIGRPWTTYTQEGIRGG